MKRITEKEPRGKAATTKKWFTANEIMDHWKIPEFELYNFVKDGLPIYDPSATKTPIEPSYQLYKKERSLEQIKKDRKEELRIQLAQTSKNLKDMMLRSPLNVLLTEERLTEYAKRMYESQPDVSRLKDASFKLEDINLFAQNHNLKPIGHGDIEAFLRDLKISRHLEDSIKIRRPGEKPKIYDLKDLGFKSSSNEGWKCLVEIFETGSFYLGPYVKKSPNKVYYQRLQHLETANEKLVSFFSDKYSLQIPDKFKLYRRVIEDRPGTYSFIFQKTADKTEEYELKYADLSEQELIAEGKKLYHAINRENDPQEKNLLTGRLRSIAAEAGKRGISEPVSKAIAGDKITYEEVPEVDSELDQDVFQDREE